jgi:phage-related tail fiber protein
MAQYKTIHTRYGLTRMAQAEATGAAINLLTMAVGDGGGNPTTPNDAQLGLVRELYRAKINRVYQDPTNADLFTAELVVPSTVGGFTIRECGVFDDQGGMFAVANIPDAYKPLGDGSEGSFGDTVIRLQFMVTNASVVTLQVDPNVVVATQAWIINNIKPATLFPGGTTGQVLKKRSNAEGDAVWSDPGATNVIVSVVEEIQTLAANQTAVILTQCTTVGLAVYVNSGRLLPSEWTPDLVDNTRFVLKKSYAAGSALNCVQNEPAAWVPTPLTQDKNLADVPNPATARANLGVYSKAETDTKAPVGMIGHFAASTPPNGWLKANGAAVGRVAYADLFARVGTTYGAGDNFNTFNLPDLRGEFIRGFDDGRGADGARAFGSAQSQAYASHNHGASADSQGSHAHGASTDVQGLHSHGGGASGIGDHAHAAWTDSQGYHAHGGATTANGDHDHNNGGYTRLLRPPYAGSLTGGDTNGSGSEQAVGAGDSADMVRTGNHVHGINGDGLHGHNIGMNGAGAHSHTIGTDAQGQHGHNVTINAGGTHAHNITVNASGGTETRPRNVALLACIKY